MGFRSRDRHIVNIHFNHRRLPRQADIIVMQSVICFLDAIFSRLSGCSVARRVALSALLLGASLAPAHAAAIWESPSWALFSELVGRVTYDSNLYGRNGGEGDTIFSLQPGLRMERRASLTKLEIAAAVNAKRFLDFSSEDSVDPRFSITYAYPNTEQILSRQEASFSWEELSHADPEVGERHRTETLDGSWDGELYNTGKTTLDAHANFTQRNVDIYDSETSHGEVGLGIGYMRHEKLKLGLAYVYSIERYKDPSLAGNANELESRSILGTVRGDLSPKVEGRVAFGFRSDDATGVTTDSNTDWEINASLDWRPTERRRVSLGMRRDSYFSSNGQLSNVTSAGFTLAQEIAGGFSASINANGSIVDQTGGGSGYDSIGFGGSLGYGLTARLTASIGGDWSDYNSDDPQSDFSAYTLYASCRFAF